MALDLSKIIAAVERDKTVNESAITLITSLAEKLRATKGDPAKVEELAAQLEAQQQALAEAVAAHTVAENEPDAEPEA